MKKSFPVILLLLVVVLTIIIASWQKIASKKPVAAKSTTGFAVVELFTSEGCSSCPSADETVARLSKKNLEHVYVLSFHVDYWNRLGWTDPFSKASYSDRQRQYASTFALDGVYTPQVVVNGATEFVGSEETKLSVAVKQNLEKNQPVHLAITTKKTGNMLSVSYTVDGKTADEQLLNIALVQPEVSTSVKRGENGGRLLHHVNVVRLLKTVDATNSGTVNLEIPKDIEALPLQAIVYLQSKKTLQIFAADQKTL